MAGLLLALLAGCRLEITVPNQGTVVTADGDFSCGPGESCVIEVSDTRFDETFVAVPAPGYSFSHWKKADRHFCGKLIKACRLFTSGFAGTDLMAFLESDETFTLTPVFVQFNQAYWTQVAAEIAGRQFTRGSFLYAIRPNADQCDPGQLIGGG